MVDWTSIGFGFAATFGVAALTIIFLADPFPQELDTKNAANLGALLGELSTSMGGFKERIPVSLGEADAAKAYKELKGLASRLSLYEKWSSHGDQRRRLLRRVGLEILAVAILGGAAMVVWGILSGADASDPLVFLFAFFAVLVAFACALEYVEYRQIEDLIRRKHRVRMAGTSPLIEDADLTQQ